MIPDVSQYGVNMPTSVGSSFQGLSGLASLVPFVGPALGAGLNFLGMHLQNRDQERFFSRYMSPASRMAQMRAAGLNPNAAAQGVTGSSAPQMTAAAPTSSFSDIGTALGESVNTSLTANAIKASTKKTDAEANYLDSLNVEKTTTNKYLDKIQAVTLSKLVSDGQISQHQANIISVDDYYKGAEALAHFEQSLLTLDTMSAQLDNIYQEYFNLLAEEYASMQAGNLSKAQISKVFSDIGLNNAQINEIEHRIDNIDASTMATMQGISESKARERLTRAHAQYQEKVNNTWNQSGWNENSDVNSNFHRLLLEGKKNEANTLLLGTQAMIIKGGEARAMSKDYKIDKMVDIIGDVTHLAGTLSISGAMRSQSSKPLEQTIHETWTSKDGVTHQYSTKSYKNYSTPDVSGRVVPRKTHR